MKSKKDAIAMLDNLKKAYPDCKCSLDFSTPFQMAISVMLSAQCTDERVNRVTPELFKKYGTPEKMAQAEVEDIETIIRSCGFYRNKAKNAFLLSKTVVEKYKGVLPETMEELQSLPGIGRKSANVIMLEAFHNPQGIAVDTHVKRISNRTGLSTKKEPEKIEQDLLKVFSKEHYYDANHLFVWHGRKTCDARHPRCEICCIKEYCNKNI